MRVVSRLAGWMLGATLMLGCSERASDPLPAIGRPDGVSQGPRVAVVVALRGDVTVEPGQGGVFPAREEMQLLHDDRLVVGPDSFVVVALHNGHVLRLNEDSRLRIDALAPFADGPAGGDIEARFAALLAPEEREDAALRGAITRVAGWNTRMTAAETIAPLPSRQAPPAPPVDEGNTPAEAPKSAPPGDVDDLGSADARAAEPQLDRPTTAPSKDARSEAEAKPKAKDRPRTDPQDSAPEVGGAPAPQAPASEQDEPASASKSPSKRPAETTGGDLPEFVTFKPADGGKALRVSLPAALKDGRLELARCAGTGKLVRARIEKMRLVELRVGDAASKCGSELLGKQVALADGWIEMTITP